MWKSPANACDWRSSHSARAFFAAGSSGSFSSNALMVLMASGYRPRPLSAIARLYRAFV